GQTDSRVRFYGQGSRYAFYLTEQQVVLSFVGQRAEAASGRRASSPAILPVADRHESDEHGVTLALKFLGSNPGTVVEGEDRAPGQVNYFRGNQPAAWRTGIPTYAQVVYRDLWPGVDLMLRGRDGALKYEFHVRPGARPSDIRLAYDGADGLSLDSAG